MTTQTAVETESEWHTCGHCGRDDVGSKNAGYATVGAIPVCTPAVDGRPNCFRLVTAYHHGMNCGPCKIADVGVSR